MAFSPSLYTYVSPREGHEYATPLLDDLNEDGKCFKNPPQNYLSKAYDAFPAPLDNGRRGGFVIHIYHLQSRPEQVHHANDLWERIRWHCKHLRLASTDRDIR
ncbi:hypothetical protein LZ30DRAFT_603101 [Colletotrichum cereale]|nr:hypothetical protein LZ30DRAFT_603101 [Colletotrichum cereale]